MQKLDIFNTFEAIFVWSVLFLDLNLPQNVLPKYSI